MTILHRTNVEIFQSGLGLQRTIVSMIDRISLYKMKNIVKKAHHNLPEPKVTSSNCFFCSTKQSEDSSLTMMTKESSKSLHLTSRNKQILNIFAWKNDKLLLFYFLLHLSTFLLLPLRFDNRWKGWHGKGRGRKRENVELDSIKCWGFETFRTCLRREKSRRRGDRWAEGRKKFEIRRASAEGAGGWRRGGSEGHTKEEKSH